MMFKAIHRISLVYGFVFTLQEIATVHTIFYFFVVPPY